MTLAGSIREHLYARRLDRHASSYAVASSHAERAAVQLELWNEEWARIARDVPFYEQELRAGRLPERFASWEEFAERMPVTTRPDVQRDGALRASRTRPAEWMRMTGGSTSEPVQLPAWKSELTLSHADVWLARSWYGVTPSSPLFLLWGHAHLLGTGVRGWLNARKRELLDRVVGYHRFSAYDLTDAAMRRAGDALLAYRPVYVLGYSVALDRLARANADRAEQFRALGIRLVVGAAEAFPGQESRERVAALFGCAVAMEYGSVETMLLAHSDPGGGYRVLWRSYMLEAEPVGAGSPLARVRVTSLTPRCFPLVRYELGDEIELDAAAAVLQLPVHRFARVVGRCNDYVELEDGSVVHSEAVTHAVRQVSHVHGYQLVVDGGEMRVQYVAAAPLTEAEAEEIRQRLIRINPAFGRVRVVQVPRLMQTRAGKTRMIVTLTAPERPTA